MSRTDDQFSSGGIKAAAASNVAVALCDPIKRQPCGTGLGARDRRPNFRFVFPKKFEKDDGFLVPRHQFMAGRAYDESTLLALADAYQRAIGLNERPPLEKFLAEKDQFLKDEKLPDENKLYID